MQYRVLGRTGVEVSRLSYGAGPVCGVMTTEGDPRQVEIMKHVLDVGVNWFDTSAKYADGQSEKSLGVVLHQLGAASDVHIATKVRLMPDELDNICKNTRASVEGSLERLRLKQVTLLQVHNSITAQRGDEATSLTPADILGPGGMLEEFKRLREDGLVRYLGITAIGQAGPLNEVVGSGEFDTIQVPYNLMNPSAGQTVLDDFKEANYGNVMATCGEHDMGVFAIRVYAAGALIKKPPQPHTYTTKFFTMDLYERDQLRAPKLEKVLGSEMTLNEAAVRFAISHDRVTSALIGTSKPANVDEALRYIEMGPLPKELLERLRQLEYHSVQLDAT